MARVLGKRKQSRSILAEAAWKWGDAVKPGICGWTLSGQAFREGAGDDEPLRTYRWPSP